jgi:hypothetical protein
MSAEAQDGVWCRQCRMRHGYKTLGFDVERRGASWYILWSCPKYFTVLEEKKLEQQGRDSQGPPEV